MAAEAKRHGFTFPYLYDEAQTAAREFDAACTPDFFVFDGAGQARLPRPVRRLASGQRDPRHRQRPARRGLELARGQTALSRSESEHRLRYQMEEELSSPPRMTPSDASCLKTFSRWLADMPGEVTALCDVLESARIAERAGAVAARERRVAGAPHPLHRAHSGRRRGARLPRRPLCVSGYRARRRGAARTPAADETSRRLAAESELVAELSRRRFRPAARGHRAGSELTRDGQRASDLLDDRRAPSAAICPAASVGERLRAPELSANGAEALKVRSFLRVRLGRS